MPKLNKYLHNKYFDLCLRISFEWVMVKEINNIYWYRQRAYNTINNNEKWGAAIVYFNSIIDRHLTTISPDVK